jgi:hypothetical protein
MADDSGGAAAETVPKARLDQSLRQREEATARAAEAEAARDQALAKVKAAETQHATLAESLAAAQKRTTELEAKHAAEREGWQAEKEFVTAGIVDADGIEVATLLYSRLPPTDRPARAAWIAGFRADPTKAPKPLTPYLTVAQAAAAGGATGTGTAGATGAGAAQGGGNANAGVVAGASTGQGGGKPSTEAIRAAAQRAAATGDSTEWNAMLRAMGVQPIAGQAK